MPSAVAKAAALEKPHEEVPQASGYQVAFPESACCGFRASSGRVPVKRDQFGADLLAVNGRSRSSSCRSKAASRAATMSPDARREFAKYAFPAGTKQWIVLWRLRARGRK